jgi:MFS family permease
VAEANTTGRPSSALRRVLIPLALAQFICSFAGSNMNVMINDMSRDPDTTVQGIQAAITIFLLVMAALMIPGGKLTDRYGRKRCFTVGLIVYGIGALLSAAAPGLGVLILGNSILEGVGTALLIPPVYILTTLLLTELTSRARAFGLISAAGGVGGASGPLIGGLITSAISWRAAFVFQALVIVTIVWLARRVQDPLPPDPTRPFDTGGAILSAVGLVLVVMGILAADNNGWLMLGLLVAGALVLAWFFRWIRVKERAGQEPLLSTELFRNRTSNLGLVTQNAQWLLLLGISFVVAAFLQVVRGYDAIQTGVIFPVGHGDRLPRGVGLCAWAAADRLGAGLDAHPLGECRAVGLPGGAAGGDLGAVAQRVQPGLVAGYRDRRHHPGRGHHQDARARLRAGHGRAGRGRPRRAPGLGAAAPDPCPSRRHRVQAMTSGPTKELTRPPDP